MNKEKIQKIIDALRSCGTHDLGDGSYYHYDEDLVEEALSIMQEEMDKPEKTPVAWMLKTGHGTQIVEEKPECFFDKWLPLYAEPPAKKAANG